MIRARILFAAALSLLAAPSHAAVTQRADGLILCSAGDTVTLPTAVNKPGRNYRVKNTGNVSCTVATTAGQTIDGSSTRSVFAGQMLTLTSDAGNWISWTNKDYPSAESLLSRATDLARGPINVALGRTYSATVGYSSYTETSGLALSDGVAASRLYGAAIAADVGWYADAPHTADVIIDLGRPCLVSQTRGYYGSNGSNVLFPTVTVSVSPDGTNYRQVFSGTYAHLEPAAAANKWLYQDFVQVPGRYLKISNANGAAKWTMAGEFQVWGVPTNTQAAANLVFTGDSLTAAAIYPNALVAGLTTGCAMTNIAVGGKTIEALIVDDVTRADSLLVPGAENVLFVWAATNDLYFGATAAATEGFLQTYCLARKAAGWNKVLVGTILPRSNAGTPGGFEAARLVFNVWLRANYATFADGLMDFAADGRIGDAGDETNTYLYSDLVHMTATGYGVVAGIALKTYLGPN